MKMIVVLTVLAVLVNCFVAGASSRSFDVKFYDYLKPQQDSQCKQVLPNCTRCLEMRSCSWCRDSLHSTGVCKSTQNCPSKRQFSCSKNSLENQLKNLYTGDRSYVFDVKEVTFNASYICHLKTNCSTCTKLEFCAWCRTKGACIAYSGATTTHFCGSKSWYKDQCSTTYPGMTTPCSDRKANCKACLSDGVCQWCESSKKCGYYQGDGTIPANCSSDQWYYESCSHVKEILVLLPIILLIMVPVFAYTIMYAILCIMRQKGYRGMDDEDDSDDDDEYPKRKPIMLRHGTPNGKTDKLRKKYDLRKKP